MTVRPAKGAVLRRAAGAFELVAPCRVAIVAACPFPTLQGSQVLIRRLAQGLQARGHAVVVVAYADGLEDALGGIAVRRIPAIAGCRARGSGPSAAKLLLDGALLAKLWRVVRAERIDVIHAHNYEAALVGLAAGRLARVPVVYHSHNALAEELPTYFRGAVARRVARALGAVADREVPRRADHCIAICHELVDFLRARGVAAVDLVAPGSSPEEFPSRSSADIEAIRARFEFGTRPLLLYAGNLDGYQNVELLLRSIGRVREAVPDALLVVATHAAPRSVRALAAGADGVRIVTADDFATIRDLLQAADVALCPRREWSGFPIKLLNYMAAGKAVVVSAGSAKAVRHRVNGWVVTDASARGYADAIVHLLGSPRLRAALGAAARRTVEDEYGWDRVLDQVEVIYATVLAARGRSDVASCPGVARRAAGCE